MKQIGKVKVKITLEVEVDGDDWALAYGTEETKEAIKSDVKEYIAGTSLGADDAQIKVTSWK